LISTLSTNSILDSIKKILNLRLINIIKNCERKQETKIYKYKQKRQIKFNFKQKYIKKRCRKQQVTSSINKKYSRNKFKAYICLFNANNNILVALLSNLVKLLFDKSIIIDFVK